MSDTDEKGLSTYHESAVEPSQPLGIDYHVTSDILADSRGIIDSAQRVARRAVNVSLVMRNWYLGRRIVEEELRGATRSELYGKELIESLSKELGLEYGRGFGKSNLYQFVKFYKTFPDIFQSETGKSHLLTWTHYNHLLRVDDPEARAWYEREAAEQGWAEKTLSRNIATQYYYRMLMTAEHNRPDVEREMQEKTAEYQADPLEFVKLWGRALSVRSLRRSRVLATNVPEGTFA